MSKEIRWIRAWFLKSMLLLGLCKVHEFTRYKACRSITDLFYWPEGFCLDTVVVIAFFLIGVWILFDEIRLLYSFGSAVAGDEIE